MGDTKNGSVQSLVAGIVYLINIHFEDRPA